MRGKQGRKWIWMGVITSLMPMMGLRAQSVSDDITQLLLDVQKLTQLKQLLSDMQKGYTILTKGYAAIRDLSQGTFNLHKGYLDGLLAVSPVVSSYEKVGGIVSKEAMLVQEYQAANRYFRGSGKFTAEELDHFSSVYTNLINGSVQNINELMMVLTAGQLRMGDAERLSAVDRIDRDISGQLSYLRSFDDRAAMQVMQRARGEQELRSLRTLYGIGP